MKLNKFLKTAIVACIAITATSSTIALAYAGDYTNYNLFINHTNNYTPDHAKDTSCDYIENSVSDMRNTDKVTFWAANADKKQISGDYDQQADNVKSTITFTTSGYNKKGVSVRMGMENYHFDLLTAQVSGYVDFK